MNVKYDRLMAAKNQAERNNPELVQAIRRAQEMARMIRAVTPPPEPEPVAIFSYR